ncbi:MULTISPECIES: hypothetical protein [Aerosakkonema]|uniref:Glutamine synthetase inactivating factor IF7 n=1 Tax=Aerosakkonema funiforme FACHB-1375 TaxID=2949571 RepID=A0A926V966_9CYAN|nr:hypothetical protein [Aerosakkonema funiforme]MBD2179599.1 hypothetical protein [Aerosakkonema funiforme FACHB-1375]
MEKQGETTMSANEQARALMMRHQHLIKNRQQSMLGRAAAEVGLSVDGEDLNVNQSKANPSVRAS